MHDLAVTSSPVPVDGPIDVVGVRPQLAGRNNRPDVMIKHHAAIGYDDRIVRPGADAIPLFWRFVSEKYGIEPASTS